MVTVFGDSELMLENMQQTAMEADFMSLEIDATSEIDKYVTAYESLQFLKDSGVEIAEEGLGTAIANAWRTFIRWIKGIIEKIKTWWRNLWKKDKKEEGKSDSKDTATSSGGGASTAETAKEVNKVKSEIKDADKKIEKAEEKKENATSESEKKAAQAVIDKVKKEKAEKVKELKALTNKGSIGIEDKGANDGSVIRMGMNTKSEPIEMGGPLGIGMDSGKVNVTIYPVLEKYVDNLAGVCNDILMSSMKVFNFSKIDSSVWVKNSKSTRDNITDVLDNQIKDKLCLGYINMSEFKDHLMSGEQKRLMTPPETRSYFGNITEKFQKKCKPAIDKLIDYLEGIRKDADKASSGSDDEVSKKTLDILRAKGQFAHTFATKVVACTNIVRKIVGSYVARGMKA